MSHSYGCLTRAEPDRFIYRQLFRPPRGGSLHRIVTVFGKKEFARIRTFCTRNRMSLYSLAKTAIREYIQRHS